MLTKATFNRAIHLGLVKNTQGLKVNKDKLLRMKLDRVELTWLERIHILFDWYKSAWFSKVSHGTAWRKTIPKGTHCSNEVHNTWLITTTKTHQFQVKKTLWFQAFFFPGKEGWWTVIRMVDLPMIKTLTFFHTRNMCSLTIYIEHITLFTDTQDYVPSNILATKIGAHYI